MRARTAPLLITLAAAFLLAGCSGSGGSETTAADAGAVSAAIPVEAGAPGVSGEMAVTDKAAQAPSTVTTERQVIRTGYVSMRVDDVAKTAFDVHALVKKRNGVVSSEDTQSTGDSTYANITAQIPAADLDAFIADISALGNVDSVSITAQDVTTQVVDLDARIKALQTSINRMSQLLAQASRIEDLLAIETQLSQRQAELDSLTAQRTWLGDQVAMSTITVTLSPKTEITDVDAPGFLSGLQSGWAAFVSLIMVAITAVGFLLPFLLVLAVIAIPLTLVIVRQTRQRQRTEAPPAPEQPTPPTE
jgi:TolA-binding protein